MSLVQRVGFYVNAVNHVFPPMKEMTQKILSVQFVMEKTIVVAPYMVSFPLKIPVQILPRQIIQHLMNMKKTEMPVLQNVLRVKFSAFMKMMPHCL